MNYDLAKLMKKALNKNKDIVKKASPSPEHEADWHYSSDTESSAAEIKTSCDFFSKLNDGDLVATQQTGYIMRYTCGDPATIEFRKATKEGIRGFGPKINNKVIKCSLKDFAKKAAQPRFPEEMIENWIKAENDKLEGRIDTIVALCSANGIEAEFFDKSKNCLSA